MFADVWNMYCTGVREIDARPRDMVATSLYGSDSRCGRCRRVRELLHVDIAGQHKTYKDHTKSA